MTEFSGSCLCGAITYEVYGQVLNMWNCHCIHCRKITGAAFATNIFINGFSDAIMIVSYLLCKLILPSTKLIYHQFNTTHLFAKKCL